MSKNLRWILQDNLKLWIKPGVGITSKLCSRNGQTFNLAIFLMIYPGLERFVESKWVWTFNSAYDYNTYPAHQYTALNRYNNYPPQEYPIYPPQDYTSYPAYSYPSHLYNPQYQVGIYFFYFCLRNQSFLSSFLIVWQKILIFCQMMFWFPKTSLLHTALEA